MEGTKNKVVLLNKTSALQDDTAWMENSELCPVKNMRRTGEETVLCGFYFFNINNTQSRIS